MQDSGSKILTLLICLVSLSACAALEPADSGPPPPQNLIGVTDELQLVTELSLNLAEEYGGQEVLIVLAIDRTLMSKDPYHRCEPVNRSTVRPIQADAAKQVRRMQDAGLRVIAVTGRGPACSALTFSELETLGFDFTASGWPPGEGYPDPFLPEAGDREVMYQEGVLLTNDQDTGAMLKGLLEKSATAHPRLIVMADSSQSELNSVIRTFSWTATKIHAWRYTRNDSAQ